MLRPRDTTARERNRRHGLRAFILDQGGVGRTGRWLARRSPGARDIARPASFDDVPKDPVARDDFEDDWCTEYGEATRPGLHSMAAQPWSEEYQADHLDLTHRGFDARDAATGEQVRNVADVASTSGMMRLGDTTKGAARDRHPKTAAHAFRRRPRKDA
jgi:hypothetical protein